MTKKVLLIPLKQYERELYSLNVNESLTDKTEIHNIILKAKNRLYFICNDYLWNNDFSMIVYTGCAHRAYEKEGKLGILQGAELLMSGEQRLESIENFRKGYNMFFESLRNNIIQNTFSLRLQFSLMGYIDMKTIEVEQKN